MVGQITHVDEDVASSTWSGSSSTTQTRRYFRSVANETFSMSSTVMPVVRQGLCHCTFWCGEVVHTSRRARPLALRIR